MVSRRKLLGCNLRRLAIADGNYVFLFFRLNRTPPQAQHTSQNNIAIHTVHNVYNNTLMHHIVNMYKKKSSRTIVWLVGVGTM
jgi:hypothetical protein